MSRPNSDELALVYAFSDGTTGHSLKGIVWNGSAWGTQSAVLESNLAYDLAGGDTKSFDAAYENSGDLLLVFGRNASAAGYYVTKTAGSSWGSAAAVGTWADEATVVSVAAAPGSDLIAAATASESSADLQYGVWNGGAWVNLTANADTTMYSPASWAGLVPVAVGWQTPSKAICVYADNGTGSIHYRSWTSSGWVNEPDFSATPNSIGYLSKQHPRFDR